jgi:hypothetical protein
VDGFDLVVLGPVVARSVQPQVARRWRGRVRNQGTVLLTAGSWPGTELEVLVSGRRWRGATADGYGHLQCHDIMATSRSRGAAMRPLSAAAQLPSPVARSWPASHRPDVDYPNSPSERGAATASAVMPGLADRRRRGTTRRRSRRRVVPPSRVMACSAAARREEPAGCGVTDRRRVPESDDAPARSGADARLFEQVAAAVERRAAGVEVARPGIVAVPVTGAAGLSGGEETLAELLLDEGAAGAGVECQVEIAATRPPAAPSWSGPAGRQSLGAAVDRGPET